jgi:hypothetical protein
MAAPTRPATWRKSLPTRSRSLIADLDASTIFNQIFFCSTAPQAFFRSRRKRTGASRGGTVKAGCLSTTTDRLGLDNGEHDGTLEDVGLPLVHASLVLLPRVMVLYAVGKYRRNIRSEAQALQCPQRAHA